jgi:hypothetical protein
LSNSEILYALGAGCADVQRAVISGISKRLFVDDVRRDPIELVKRVLTKLPQQQGHPENLLICM